VQTVRRRHRYVHTLTSFPRHGDCARGRTRVGRFAAEISFHLLFPASPGEDARRHPQRDCLAASVRHLHPIAVAKPPSPPTIVVAVAAHITPTTQRTDVSFACRSSAVVQAVTSFKQRTTSRPRRRPNRPPTRDGAHAHATTHPSHTHIALPFAQRPRRVVREEHPFTSCCCGKPSRACAPSSLLPLSLIIIISIISCACFGVASAC